MINKAILACLWDAVCFEAFKSMGEQRLGSPLCQMPLHITHCLYSSNLTNCHTVMLPLPPCSSHLAPCDFYCFS
jgi:hypothetical protein